MHNKHIRYDTTWHVMQVGKLDAATTIASDLLLDLNNELSYNPRPVAKLLLLCLQAAERGGENLLARNADVTNCLAPSTLHRFNEKGGIRQVNMMCTDPGAVVIPVTVISVQMAK